MKFFQLFLLSALVAGASFSQAQVKSGSKGSSAETVPAEQPVRSKPGSTASQSTEQGSTTTTEPVADLNKLTTADQVRAFAQAKVTWLEGEVGTLTNEQKKAIQGNFEKAYGEIKAIKEANPEMTRAELRSKAEPLIVSARSRSLEVLTPEQQANLDSWQAGRQNTAMDAARKRAQSQTEELDKVVGLSNDQKQQVLDLNTGLWMEGRDWKTANPNASAEEKKAYAKEMTLKRMEGYKNILTEDQKAKLVENRKALENGTDME